MKKHLILGIPLALLPFFAAQNVFANTQDLHDNQGSGSYSFKRHYKNQQFNLGPKGFDSETCKSVKDVLVKASNDDKVIIKGSLTKFLGDDKYEFTDINGDSITLELDDDKDWSFISKGMPIEILAEVDKDLMSTSLEAIAARPVMEQKNPAPSEAKDR